MKTFEQVSSMMGSQRDSLKFMPQKMNLPASGVNELNCPVIVHE